MHTDSPSGTPAFGLEPVVASLLPVGALPPLALTFVRCHPESVGEISPRTPLGSPSLGGVLNKNAGQKLLGVSKRNSL